MNIHAGGGGWVSGSPGFRHTVGRPSAAILFFFFFCTSNPMCWILPDRTGFPRPDGRF